MNVLILTDFSPVAVNASKYAMHFLKNVPVKFYLFNFEKFEQIEEKELVPEGDQAVAVVNLYRHFKDLKKYSTNKDHTFQAVFSEDNLVNSTRRFVAEKSIDLIVMGAAGRDSEKNTILGNHTYEIIRKIKCNVLAVPVDTAHLQPGNIVFPINYATSFNRSVFKFFEHKEILPHTAVTVLELKENSILPPKNNPREQVTDYLKNRKLRFIEIKEKDIYIKESLQKVQEKFNMIVILAKNLSICNGFLDVEHRSCTGVTNKLPILVLHG